MASAKSTRAPARNVSAKSTPRRRKAKALPVAASAPKSPATADAAEEAVFADEISLNELAKTLHDWDMKRRHKEYLVKYFCAVLGDSEEELKEALEGWADDPAEATYRAACELEDEYCTRSLREAMNRTDAALDVLADNWEEIGREHVILLIDALRQRVSQLGQHLDAALAERFCMAYRGERGVDLDEPYIVSKKIQLLDLPKEWSA